MIMYAKIVRKLHNVKSTGTSTHVQLIRQRVCLGRVCPPIYHVGLLVDSGTGRHIFEHGPIAYDQRRDIDFSLVVPLPTVWNSIGDILDFEDTLPKHYIVGVRDCRHHVLDLLDYLYGDEN